MRNATYRYESVFIPYDEGHPPPSSAVLSDRTRFPYYFQLLPSEVNLACVFYSVIKEYG
jgi:hypothetical protein